MRPVTRAFALVAVAALVAPVLVAINATPASAAGDVTGTVFRDFNSNGVIDTTGGPGVAVDVGVPDVTVTGYDADGASISATTGLDGTYTLSVPGDVGSDLRVEFSGLPAGFEPSAAGALGHTTVQFVEVGASEVNLGINVPEDHSQSNPPLITAIQRAGEHTHPDIADEPAITALPWDAGYLSSSAQGSGFPARTTLATTEQVGSTWGTAFQARQNSLYAAATLKRHSGLGPLGLGGIYRVNEVLGTDGEVTTATPAVDEWLDVQGQVITGGGGDLVNVGSVDSDADRGLGSPSLPSTDIDGFVKAGKVGIGGIAVSTDQTLLYFVNLFDRNLYSIDISDPTDTSPEIRRYDLELTGEQRPWGITVHRDQVYVGYVDTGEGLAEPTSAAAAGLEAHLIRANESDSHQLVGRPARCLARLRERPSCHRWRDPQRDRAPRPVEYVDGSMAVG